MKRILDGENPSDIFKALLRDKPAFTTADLALEFRKAFPSTGVDGMSVIWKWKMPGTKVGLSDAALDDQLRYWLTQYGYLRDAELK
jgi:hypothetical protein